MRFTEAVQEFNDWMITIPKKVDWEQYLQELKDSHDNGDVANFRVANFPKKMRPGDKCYIVHDGELKGWTEVLATKHWPEGFRCTSTGHEWPPGKYIQRSCDFQPLYQTMKIKGFQGVRRKTDGMG